MDAARYRACQPGQEQGWTVFVQGFTFTDGRTRGCVPLPASPVTRRGRFASLREDLAMACGYPRLNPAESRQLGSYRGEHQIRMN